MSTNICKCFWLFPFNLFSPITFIFFRIRLYCNLNKISGNVNDNIISVIQEYIEHPLLIDGYKCDLRVYVLVTSCDPLKIFIYNEGLVRLSAEKYVKPSEPSGVSLNLINKSSFLYEMFS